MPLLPLLPEALVGSGVAVGADVAVGAGVEVPPPAFSALLLLPELPGAVWSPLPWPLFCCEPLPLLPEALVGAGVAVGADVAVGAGVEVPPPAFSALLLLPELPGAVWSPLPWPLFCCEPLPLLPEALVGAGVAVGADVAVGAGVEVPPPAFSALLWLPELPGAVWSPLPWPLFCCEPLPLLPLLP